VRDVPVVGRRASKETCRHRRIGRSSKRPPPRPRSYAPAGSVKVSPAAPGPSLRAVPP
jgi:hypothetical protein